MVDTAEYGPGPGGLPSGPDPVESTRAVWPWAGEVVPVEGGYAPPRDLAGAAATLFGPRLPLAVAYAELLATDGVVRGLIGPRETSRIWDRHLLNCAAMAGLIPADQLVTDVGSGAGLPGIVLGIARPDLAVVLVEPLARRTSFLTEAIEKLGLGSTVTVVRARAEEYRSTGASLADIVTARAVAPLDRLAGWCLPLVDVGGRLLAMKGASAANEVVEHEDAVRRVGGGQPVIRHCGAGLVEPPTTVIDVVRERQVNPGKSGRSRRGGRSQRLG